MTYNVQPSRTTSGLSVWSTAVVTLLLALLGIPSLQAQTFSLLHTFGGAPDGAYPEAGFVQDAAGNLYGTTQLGGSIAGVCSTVSGFNGINGCGTVFKVDTNGTESVLYRFTGGVDGKFPSAGLVLDSAGNVYGSTAAAIFKLDTARTLTPLHSPGADAGLVADPNGNLYGTSPEGLFKLTPAGTFTVLDAAVRSNALLAVDVAGNVYGTTENGGNTSSQCSNNSCGTVFKLDAVSGFSTLHSFSADGHDGFNPAAGVIVDSTGNLYGTTLSGGAPNCIGGQHNPVGCGTVFRIDPTGTESAVSFQGGDYPNVGLVRDTAGNLYGTTEWSGPAAGTPALLYEMTPSGVETELFQFAAAALARAYPTGNLLQDASGNLFGSTQFGGSVGAGTVFKLNPSGPPTYAVTVAAAGTGTGTVVGNPPVINCLPVCSAFLAPGTAVSLTATAASNSTFAGWNGPCSGTGSCSVTSGTAELVVFATFNLLPPDFSLSVSPLKPSSLSPGAAASSMLTLSAQGGFKGSVALTCSVAPAPVLAPACSIAPSSAAPGTPATLTVTTTGPSGALQPGSSGLLYALCLPLIGLIPMGARRRSEPGAGKATLVAAVLACLIVVGLTFQVACGGSSTSTGSGGTPAGTYTIMVTGTYPAGSLAHSTPITLVVQ